MKFILSLSLAAFLSLASFSQDTLPSPVVASSAPVVEATEPGAPTSLEAREQILVNELAKLKALKASLVPAPASADEPVWKTLLYSPVLIGVLVMLAVFGLKKMDENGTIDADKWVALTYHIYGAAEKSGALNNWKGHDKLNHALDLFSVEFTKAFGHAPTEQNIAEVKHDLARLAYEDETTLNQRIQANQLTPIVVGRSVSAPMDGQQVPLRGVSNLIQKTE